MKYDLSNIKKRAMKNAKERLVLIDAMERKVRENKSLEKDIGKIACSFLRKLFYYPGDITTHRIVTVIKKLEGKLK